VTSSSRQPAVPEELLSDDFKYDALVVGGGNAALCAAIGKFVHGFYRLVALVRYAREMKQHERNK
jgi:succinate dehydrogenase/fumarate reductase flavoprotein subunit